MSAFIDASNIAIYWIHPSASQLHLQNQNWRIFRMNWRKWQNGTNWGCNWKYQKPSWRKLRTIIRQTNAVKSRCWPGGVTIHKSPGLSWQKLWDKLDVKFWQKDWEKKVRNVCASLRCEQCHKGASTNYFPNIVSLWSYLWLLLPPSSNVMHTHHPQKVTYTFRSSERNN